MTSTPEISSKKRVHCFTFFGDDYKFTSEELAKLKKKQMLKGFSSVREAWIDSLMELIEDILKVIEPDKEYENPLTHTIFKIDGDLFEKMKLGVIKYRTRQKFKEVGFPPFRPNFDFLKG